MADVISLQSARNRKRLAEFDQTIEHFVRIATEANQCACDAEAAKQSFIDSLTEPALVPA